MKDLQHDTNFGAAVKESPAEETIDETVSFAPETEIDSTVLEKFERVLEADIDTADDTDIENTISDIEVQIDSEQDTIEAKTATTGIEDVEHDLVDTEIDDTEDGAEWNEGEPVLVYDVPRPALTIDEAATILGKSIRAIERGISGKWGNRLPEGWKARKMKIDGQDEWRIIPPPGFRVRHSKVRTPRTETMTNKTFEKPAPAKTTEESESVRPSAHARSIPTEEPLGLRETAENLFGFSFNNLIQSAGKKAKTELAKAAEYAMESSMEHPTIVIDRSDEVERLLRQLAEVQKELSEERRLHLEDLRMLAEMQGSMRLLELKSSQTQVLKDELLDATRALQEHKRQYQAFLALPWWKRLFKNAP